MPEKIVKAKKTPMKNHVLSFLAEDKVKIEEQVIEKFFLL